jgi:hypothetical protein
MSKPANLCPICEHPSSDHDHQYGCNRDGCDCDLSWRDIKRDFWPDTSANSSGLGDGELTQDQAAYCRERAEERRRVWAEHAAVSDMTKDRTRK